jgi:transcriptional regulator with XRE-family HTH domain
MTATKYEQIWHSLEDEEYRREFNADVDTGLAFQIRALREKNGWTQGELAERAGSDQGTISQWENPNYGRYTLKTLKSLANAFDVGLLVRFAPFSELALWHATLTPRSLAPHSFDEENSSHQLLATSPTLATGWVLTTTTPVGEPFTATASLEPSGHYAVYVGTTAPIESEVPELRIRRIALASENTAMEVRHGVAA